MTKQKMLKALNQIETARVGFWSRNSDDTITINVRGAHGNDPNQWINARAIEAFFGTSVRECAQPDPISGHIVLKIKGFYKSAKGAK